MPGDFQGTARPASWASIPLKPSGAADVSVASSIATDSARGPNPHRRVYYRRSSNSAKQTCAQRLSPGLRRWIEQRGATPASTPMWTSRDAWLRGLRQWVHSDALREATTRLNVSITSATLIAIAAKMADFADHRTGRNMAATRATIAAAAGCSPRTVTTAWTVLRETHWAVEAVRGHGSGHTSARGCRPSVWHLTPHRDAVEFCHLPTTRRVGGNTPASNSSPTARCRAPGNNSPSSAPGRRRYRGAPRPLSIQRLAAELVTASQPGQDPLCRGLSRGHIGAICDALTTAGIDPARWSARDIKNALDADMRARGWSWPDRIHRPGAFLSSRLRQLPATAVPTCPGRSAAHPPNTHDEDCASQRRNAELATWYRRLRAVTTEEDRQRILEAHRRQFGFVADPVLALAHAARRSTLRHPNVPLHAALGQWTTTVLETLSPSKPPSNDLLTEVQRGGCVACGTAHAPMRIELPAPIPVCDSCWSHAQSEDHDQHSPKRLTP